MSQIDLRKLLTKPRGPASLLKALLDGLDEPVSILDAENQRVFGTPLDNGQPASDPLPVLHDGLPVGWVLGHKGSRWQTQMAALLTFLVGQEAEKRDLASEVLDKYRELHMLYRLSEKLVTSPHPETIAQTSLNEACPLIQVIAGMVVLKHQDSDILESIATCGRPMDLNMNTLRSGNMICRVLQTGIAELANQLPADGYFSGLELPSISLLCAPLKTEQRVLGAIIMVGDPDKQFTAGDLKLLNAIAMQTAPAIEIAHLHQSELEKERLERDLQVARQVQSDLLPREMPQLKGWRTSTYWKPAQAVGGDFYDFNYFPNGNLGVVIADVSDKGVPAALVMASARSVLRAVAASKDGDVHTSPGKLLAQVNDVLCIDMPKYMFVTCLLVILDPLTGQLRYANAGHNPPYQRTANGVIELRASGMPLGLFPDRTYDDQETVLEVGDSLLLYSDGLVEAHNAQTEMFGYPRLRHLLAQASGKAPLDGEGLIRFLTSQLADFTGLNWTQEDDVTFVTLDRLPAGK
jgi:serine phosphatase RsbU (regulator of sigma subunit)